MKIRLIKFLKDFFLYTGILQMFSSFNRLFLFICNFNNLENWIKSNRKGLIINDFYSVRRNYDKRYKLYASIISHYNFTEKEIIYVEFGVAEAHSFKWWATHNTNVDSKFFGFDTFEGLPENWGAFYKKGDMSSSLPDIGDSRAKFIKGIFQDTLPAFLDETENSLKIKQKIIHMDADLFSSTIFVLSQLYRFLNKGDIILFDEFNVANHEFFAFKIFTESFYVKLRPVAAQNNFYQTAFVVE